MIGTVKELLEAGYNPMRFWKCGPNGRTPDGVQPMCRPGPGGLRLLWAFQMMGIGSAYGVATHANRMRDALSAAGVLVFSSDDDCDIALHFTQPELFSPLPGRKNLLFCTCEMSEPTDAFAARPDLLVVPCEYNRQVFSRYYDGPIEVSPEGVDPVAFPYHERHAPCADEPFVVLFCGNINDSTKGFGLTISAWDLWRASGTMPRNAILYVKTTGLAAPPMQFFTIVDGRLEQAAMPSLRCVILDNRDLPVEQLRDLYHHAHALVSPSMGEAFNLVLAEAFRTGLPSVFSLHTGMLDYATPDMGFAITDFSRHVFREEEPGYFGLAADPSDIVARLVQLHDDYPGALARGRRALEVMQGYTWSRAAKRLIEICEVYT